MRNAPARLPKFQNRNCFKSDALKWKRRSYTSIIAGFSISALNAARSSAPSTPPELRARPQRQGATDQKRVIRRLHSENDGRIALGASAPRLNRSLSL
jgi:hypothetical protein